MAKENLAVKSNEILPQRVEPALKHEMGNVVVTRNTSELAEINPKLPYKISASDEVFATRCLSHLGLDSRRYAFLRVENHEPNKDIKIYYRLEELSDPKAEEALTRKNSAYDFEVVEITNEQIEVRCIKDSLVTVFGDYILEDYQRGRRILALESKNLY